VLHPFLFTATVMVLPKRCEVRFTHPRISCSALRYAQI
jgi:hypothetical protein